MGHLPEPAVLDWNWRWDVGHVRFIFIFVRCGVRSLPEAYASVTLTLLVPVGIAALGIVLRGARFALREAVVTTRYHRCSGVHPLLVGGVWTATAAADLSGVDLAWDADAEPDGGGSR